MAPWWLRTSDDEKDEENDGPTAAAVDRESGNRSAPRDQDRTGSPQKGAPEPSSSQSDTRPWWAGGRGSETESGTAKGGPRQTTGSNDTREIDVQALRDANLEDEVGPEGGERKRSPRNKRQPTERPAKKTPRDEEPNDDSSEEPRRRRRRRRSRRKPKGTDETSREPHDSTSSEEPPRNPPRRTRSSADARGRESSRETAEAAGRDDRKTARERSDERGQSTSQTRATRKAPSKTSSRTSGKDSGRTSGKDSTRTSGKDSGKDSARTSGKDSARRRDRPEVEAPSIESLVDLEPQPVDLESETVERSLLYSLVDRPATSDERKIAVFCDFENIAIGVRESEIKKLDINLILARLLQKGKIIVKKAYADWERYSEYKRPFHEAAIELIDIPQKYYSGKNSADIKMVVDAMDLCYSKEHLDTFVIVSGDSDFSPLVSKLKENNKYVIGIGVKNSSSSLLIDNCDEFIYYEDVWRMAQQRPHLDNLPPKQAEAFGLMSDAMLALMRESKDVLWGSLIKQTMQRMRPSFNESYYGYSTFTELLEDAARRRIIGLRRDQRSGNWVVTGFVVRR